MFFQLVQKVSVPEPLQDGLTASPDASAENGDCAVLARRRPPVKAKAAEPQRAGKHSHVSRQQSDLQGSSYLAADLQHCQVEGPGRQALPWPSASESFEFPAPKPSHTLDKPARLNLARLECWQALCDNIEHYAVNPLSTSSRPDRLCDHRHHLSVGWSSSVLTYLSSQDDRTSSEDSFSGGIYTPSQETG